MNPLPALARVLWVTILGTAFAAAFAVRRWFDRHAGPVLLRQFLQSAGACFVKAGQVLATRYDVLPAEYCEELSKLFDRMPSVSLAMARQVVESDLKRPLEEIFSEFEPIPLASASIAQVHGAILRSGEPVVVKVMRPGIEKMFRVDLGLIRRIARFSRRHRAILRIDLTPLARDFIELTREELDFTREARNTDRMRRLMRSDTVDHCAPRVFFEYSGARVITMERVQGVAVIDLMTAAERGDAARLDLWAARGITPQRTADTLLRSVLEQTMRHRVFQADPHPANLIVLDGGTLAWVDFGMVGWLDEHTWLQQFRLRTEVAFGRIHGAYQRLLEVFQPLPAGDLSGFELRVKAIIRDYTEASSDPNAGVRDKSVGFFFLRLFGAIRESGLSLPANVMRLYRTIIVADGVMLRLDPAIDWVAILRGFIEAEAKRQLGHTLKETLSAPSLAQMLAGALHAPEAAVQLIDWLNSGLPAMGWRYRQRVTLLERALLTSIGLLRGIFFVAVVAVVGSRAAGSLAPGSAWAMPDRTIGGYWWVVALVGVVAVVTLSRMLDDIEGS